MLWYLHLCADAGVTVIAYRDDASGEMAMHRDGSGEFTRVTLRPKVTVTQGSDAEKAHALHGEVHKFCFIARSVNFPVMSSRKSPWQHLDRLAIAVALGNRRAFPRMGPQRRATLSERA